MKSVYIVCQTQFGYHIDSYYYAKYLSEIYSVSYICYDDNKPKYKMPLVNVIYLSRNSSKLLGHLHFLTTVRTIISESNSPYVFVKHFAFCSLLVLFNRRVKCCNIDVRTGSVSPSVIKRFFEDFFIYVDSLFYKTQTVISKSLKNKWFIRKDAFILPLGAEVYKREYSYENSCKGKNLVLFYVGSITGRRLDVIISGLHIYIANNPDSKIVLKIAGSYDNADGRRLLELTQHYKLNEKVEFLGYLTRDDLYKNLDRVDVGIVHVPKTSYYDCQPSTKLFEFLLSGIPVLASDTLENINTVGVGMGLIYNGNSSESFANAIENIISDLNSGSIKIDMACLGRYSWESIALSLAELIQESSNE